MRRERLVAQRHVTAGHFDQRLARAGRDAHAHRPGSVVAQHDVGNMAVGMRSGSEQARSAASQGRPRSGLQAREHAQLERVAGVEGRLGVVHRQRPFVGRVGAASRSSSTEGRSVA